MNRRLLLAAATLALLVLGAGCLGYVTGGGEISDERLDRAPAEPYVWDSERDAHITVRADAEFQAVYRVEEGDRLKLYRPTGYGTEDPLKVESVRFRYENGTEVNGSEFEDHGGKIEQTTDEVWISPPGDGKVAITAGSTPKRFTLPVYVEGSYEVVLPEDRRVDFFLFGKISPRGYETTVDENGRVHVTWDEVGGESILVQFYIQRDLHIFAAAVAVLAGIGMFGLYYYRRQIDRLHEARVEMGLDVEGDGGDGGENDEGR